MHKTFFRFKYILYLNGNHIDENISSGALKMTTEQRDGTADMRRRSRWLAHPITVTRCSYFNNYSQSGPIDF